jgi:hypothetical protein
MAAGGACSLLVGAGSRQVGHHPLGWIRPQQSARAAYPIPDRNARRLGDPAQVGPSENDRLAATCPGHVTASVPDRPAMLSGRKLPLQWTRCTALPGMRLPAARPAPARRRSVRGARMITPPMTRPNRDGRTTPQQHHQRLAPRGPWRSATVQAIRRTCVSQTSERSRLPRYAAPAGARHTKPGP